MSEVIENTARATLEIAGIKLTIDVPTLPQAAPGTFIKASNLSMLPAAIPAPDLAEGEFYAGIVFGKAGEPNHHLVLMDYIVTATSWAAGMEWAAGLGGDLPSRREQALLFANLPEYFKPERYWSNEHCSGVPSYAWMQNFGHGGQNYYHESYEFAARPIRRLIIQ